MLEGKIDGKKLAALGAAAMKEMSGLEEHMLEFLKLYTSPRSVGLSISFGNDGVKISQKQGDNGFDAGVRIGKDGGITVLGRGRKDDDQPAQAEIRFKIYDSQFTFAGCRLACLAGNAQPHGCRLLFRL